MLNRNFFLAPLDIDSLQASPEVDLVADLLKTRAVQRLGFLRFLGAIDYSLVKTPNGAPSNVRHTRLQHSLGVARLAMFYSKIRDLPAREGMYVTAAALLHDVGHAPLSHSLEPEFKRIFGIDHHSITEQIVCGNIPLGEEVRQVLASYKLEPSEVVEIISGRNEKFDAFFSGPINFDTIEGIMRTFSYLRSGEPIFAPETVVCAAMRRGGDDDRRVVDEFWSYKNVIYKNIINSKSGILADGACQGFMQANVGKFKASDFLLTEPRLFDRFPGLRTLLANLDKVDALGAVIRFPLTYRVRQFYIDAGQDFYTRNDSRRYLQRKIPRTLHRNQTAQSKTPERYGDLFKHVAL